MGEVVWFFKLLILVLSCQGFAAIVEGGQESAPGVNDMKNHQNHTQAMSQELMDSFDLLLNLTIQEEKPGNFSWEFTNKNDKCQTNVEARIDTLKNNLDHKLNTLKEGLENTLGNTNLQFNDMISQKLTNYSTVSKTDIKNSVETLLMSFHRQFVQSLSDFEKRMDEKLAQSQNVSQKTTTCNAGMAYVGKKRYSGLEIIEDSTLNKNILCEAKPECEGWIVIQRRMKGDVDFYRNWDEYKNGFGTPPGDFWLGNEAIHELTKKSEYELRIDYNNGTKDLFALYSSFKVESEAKYYRLRLGSHSGTLGEDSSAFGLSYSNGSPFSTYDRDHDEKDVGSCATLRHGGWWFKNCHRGYLNGIWRRYDSSGISWVSGSLVYYANSTQMKIRRKDM